MFAVVLALPLWGVVVLVFMLIWPEPLRLSVPNSVSVAVVVERADATERAGSAEGAAGKVRARASESAVIDERAVSAESAGATERADVSEGATRVERAVSAQGIETTERAATAESADDNARAVRAESAEDNARAENGEGADKEERADAAESTDDNARVAVPESADLTERAETEESADPDERPRLKTGYPQILSPSHTLWDDQQAGWPDHLPHQAWRATAYTQSRDEAFQKVSSADHPAFGEGYVPNYAATPEAPSADYIAHRQGKARR